MREHLDSEGALEVVAQAVPRQDVAKRVPHDAHAIEERKHDEPTPSTLGSGSSGPGAAVAGGAAAG
eukprot:3352705-Alexandrium_andersonii.AAC.1